MPRFTIGQTLIIDKLQRKLDDIEKTWQMIGSYKRIDPYSVPYLQAGDYYELIIYHIESQAWFDNTNADGIARMIADCKLVSEGQVVFDLGSNAGALTVILARLVGETGRVHAFDPFPWNAAATLANCELNYFQNVTMHQVGVSNHASRISVHPGESRSYVANDSVTAQEIAIDSLASYMKHKPSFLKIDIEGAEHDIFLEASSSDFGTVERFVLEFHPGWLQQRGVEPKDVLRNIERAGFTLHYHHPDTPTYAVEHFQENHHLFWAKRKGVAA